MKRYFEIMGKNQTLKLDVIVGSAASAATPEELSKELKVNLREIDKVEYRKLTKLYAK